MTMTMKMIAVPLLCLVLSQGALALRLLPNEKDGREALKQNLDKANEALDSLAKSVQGANEGAQGVAGDIQVEAAKRAKDGREAWKQNLDKAKEALGSLAESVQGAKFSDATEGAGKAAEGTLAGAASAAEGISTEASQRTAASRSVWKSNLAKASDALVDLQASLENLGEKSKQTAVAEYEHPFVAETASDVQEEAGRRARESRKTWKDNLQVAKDAVGSIQKSFDDIGTESEKGSATTTEYEHPAASEAVFEGRETMVKAWKAAVKSAQDGLAGMSPKKDAGSLLEAESEADEEGPKGGKKGGKKCGKGVPKKCKSLCKNKATEKYVCNTTPECIKVLYPRTKC